MTIHCHRARYRADLFEILYGSNFQSHVFQTPSVAIGHVSLTTFIRQAYHVKGIKRRCGMFS